MVKLVDIILYHAFGTKERPMLFGCFGEKSGHLKKWGNCCIIDHTFPRKERVR